MDEYRQTLLGRALADVLQEMEMSGAIEEHESDSLFSIFDDVVQSEFEMAQATRTTTTTAKRAKATKATTPPSTASEERDSSVGPVAPPPPLLFTHRMMEIKGQVHSFNRFMDKWSLHASIENRNGGNTGTGNTNRSSIRLDGMAVDLHLPVQEYSSVEILVKLHNPDAKSSR